MIDIQKNKFIVFHHGGGGGDFLCSAVNYLHDKINNQLKIFESGQFNGPDNNYDSFKNYSEKLTITGSCDDKFTTYHCMASHYYSPLLDNVFKNSKFYYINNENYEENLYDRLQKLNIYTNETPLKIFRNGKEFTIKENKEKKKIKIATIKSWKKIFNFYQIEPIKFEDLLNYNSFRQILETKFLLKCDDHLEEFYNEWLEKNYNNIKIL